MTGGFLERHTVGFERFVPYLTGASDGVTKDAQWAASNRRGRRGRHSDARPGAWRRGAR